jgi:hypothetical protein
MPLFTVFDSVNKYPLINRDNFLAYSDYTKGLEHYYYYSNYMDVRKEIINKDVILLGNSRLQMGIDYDVLQRYLSKYQLQSYMLGFGYHEGCGFAIPLLKKLDVHPKYAIINIDDFFRNDTPMGLKVLRTSTQACYKYIISNFIKFNLFSRSTFFLQHLLPIAEDNNVYLRNRKTGAWDQSHIKERYTRKPQAGIDGKRGEWGEVDEAMIPIVLEYFVKNNIQPIFVYIPNNLKYDFTKAQEFSHKYGLTLVPNGDTSSLYTCDHSHLTPDSTICFTNNLVEQLERMSIFAAR